MNGPLDIVIACCRDEADIITSFIDFYLSQGFDKIFLIDNGSVDGTLQQILDHPKQQNITLLKDPRPGYDIRLLEYYRMFLQFGTRWVFFIDVDEFVLVPGGIKRFAADLPSDVTLLELPTAEMHPIADASSDLSPLLSTRRDAAFHKEGKVVWKAVEVRKIFCGKHDVIIEPRVAFNDARVFIRHYHTRSSPQLRHKLRNRIETEDAVGALADEFTAFDSSQRKAWIEHSRDLLNSNGWIKEKERYATQPATDDGIIAEWYLAHNQSNGQLTFSPIISLDHDTAGWFCFCTRSLRAQEGHTSHEHLVMFYSTTWRDTALTRPVYSADMTVPVRLHSECLLGDVFAADRCDCGYQLDAAMTRIRESDGGVIIYLRQEGRGVGLFDKLRSLTIVHDDTFHRNEVLGLPGDSRGYGMAAEVLRCLGIGKALLLSGNTAKAKALQAAGIETRMESRIVLRGLAPEALREIHAKLRKGYSYELLENPPPPLSDLETRATNTDAMNSSI